MVRKQSKRQSLKKKYFVQKKIRDFHRKQRKKDRENAKKGIRQRTRKDPGIPNVCPFKQDLMADLEKQQQQDLADKERRRQRLREQREVEKEIAKGTYVKPEPPERIKKPKKKKPNFFREIKKVVEESDVILEVLDSRDPLGSRCYAVEEYIQNEHPQKKIAYVLNKIDLIPKENIKDWLRYLSLSNPTVAFKCSLIDQQKKLGQITHMNGVPKRISETLGEEALYTLLRDFRKQLDKPITVGIIGYPNVGKSSLINSLKRSETAPVGAMPHFTKVARAFQLEKDIRVMDSPGVIFSSQIHGADTIIRNIVDVDTVANTVGPVEEIFKRCNHERLLTLYKLNVFKTYYEFLDQIASKRSKAGRRKYTSSARLVLVDLITHKIPFYNIPPTAEYDANAKKKGDLAVKKHLPVLKLLEDVNERIYLPIQSDPPAERAKTQISLETLTEKFNEPEEIEEEDHEEDASDDESGDDENDDDSDEEMEDGDEDEEEEEEEEEEEKPKKNGKRKEEKKSFSKNKKAKKEVVMEDDDDDEEAGEDFDFATDFKAGNDDGEEDEDEEDEEDDD